MARGGVFPAFFAYMQLLQRDKRLGVWKDADAEGEDSHIWRLAQQLGMRCQGDEAEVRETMCQLEEVWANSSVGRCCAWRRATPPRATGAPLVALAKYSGSPIAFAP